MARPVTGIFIAWDVEEVDVERLDAGTIHDRTVVTARRTVVKTGLWSNKISDKLIAAAQAHVEREKSGYENMRVQVFTKENKRP